MNILTPVFSFIGAICGGYLVWLLNRHSEKYQKLYGPLRFNLQMMKIITTNNEEVVADIKKWANVETQIDLMTKHLPPLTEKWINHVTNVKTLFEQNSGLINKCDFDLMSDFMDGYVKREITEGGKNLMAIEDGRRGKLLDAIKNLQERLL